MLYFWAALEKNAPFILNLGFTMILARLIAPEVYGIVAMTAIFTALGTVILNSGFGAALIQRKSISDDDTTSVFIANVFLGSVVTTVLIAFAAPIAEFFQRPELVQVIWVNAATLFLAAFAIIQNTIMQKRFLFKKGLVIEVLATIAAGIVAVSLAYQGYSLWALLALILVRQLAQTLLLWVLIRWRPTGSFSFESLRSLWRFARHMIGASLYHHFSTNLVSVLLAKFYSATTLGLFARAQSLRMLPESLIVGPVQRVAFPLFSQYQDDFIQLVGNLRGQCRNLAIIAGMLTAGVFCCAREMVLILVGDGWVESIPMLEVLSWAIFASILFPLHSEANKAIGESTWFFWVEIVKKTALVIGVTIGVLQGVQPLLWILVALSVVDYVLSASSSVRFLNYTIVQQAADILPALALTGIAAYLGSHVLELFGEVNLFSALLIKGATVLLVFTIAVLVFGIQFFPNLQKKLFARMKEQA
ncbi:MAG: lipopolysaccharide biosynthesis protein [Pseudomonadota bacterium]